MMKKPAWIWHAGESQWNETVDFHTCFRVHDPRKCRMRVSVNTFYALYVNGTLTEMDQFNDFSFDKRFDELDLSEAVTEGENEMILSVNWQGDASSTYTPFEPGAWFVIYETDEEKKQKADLQAADRVHGQILAVSGEETLCRINRHYSARCEKITVQLSYSFRYDARAKEDLWQRAVCVQRDFILTERPVRKLCVEPIHPSTLADVGYFKDLSGEALSEDPENTRTSHLMQHAWLRTRMPSRVITLDGQETVRIHPDRTDLDLLPMNEEKDGVMILADLGKEMSGFFEMDVDLPKDCDILIGWGEHLDDLRIRTEIDHRNFAALYRGKKGKNHFCYPFKRMGLRYLQLHVYAEEFGLRYVGIRPACYPVEKVKLFTCADLLHEQIYRTCLRTLQNSMHTHYEDCPWREQGLYTMDSRNQMLCGYYCFEEYDFAKASLRLLAEGLRSDHLLELCSPGQVPLTIPSFTAIYLIELEEYARYSGDVEFVRQMLPVALHIADTMLERRNEQGLVPNWEGKAYWNFYEWQEGLDGEGEKYYGAECPMNAFLSLGLLKLSKLCHLLGELNLESLYQKEQKLLNEAMNRIFWVEEKGMYSTREQGHYCELTQALMICCEAAGERESILQEKLAGLIQTEEVFYPVTLSYSVFKYEALLKNPDRYGRMVFRQIGQLYGKMLYHDATTFWETSDGARAFHNAGSLCHGWSAIPVWLYLRYVMDSKAEGGKLTVQQSGIYESSLSEWENPYRHILEDQWL